jgi:hypothetical protein
VFAQLRLKRGNKWRLEEGFWGELYIKLTTNEVLFASHAHVRMKAERGCYTSKLLLTSFTLNNVCVYFHSEMTSGQNIEAPWGRFGTKVHLICNHHENDQAKYQFSFFSTSHIFYKNKIQ